MSTKYEAIVNNQILLQVLSMKSHRDIILVIYYYLLSPV